MANRSPRWHFVEKNADGPSAFYQGVAAGFGVGRGPDRGVGDGSPLPGGRTLKFGLRVGVGEGWTDGEGDGDGEAVGLGLGVGVGDFTLVFRLKLVLRL